MLTLNLKSYFVFWMDLIDTTDLLMEAMNLLVDPRSTFNVFGFVSFNL